MITIVGFGLEKGEVTLRGLKAVKEADRVFVRTSALAAAETLAEEGVSFETFDELYESSRNYDSFTNKAVRVLRSAGKNAEICYCTDGGVTEDRISAALAGGRGIRTIGGESRAARFAAAAGLDGGYMSVSAFEIKGRELCLPLVVYDISRGLAGDVKLRLSERFGDEAPAYYIQGDRCTKIALFETDRQTEYSSRCALVLPDLPLLEKKRFGFDDFTELVRRLRAPGGCPWDRAQTHESVRADCLEEAYELVDAIDRNDVDRMLEETGDVLMQAVFHAVIEEERGGFTVNDMTTAVTEKLISRHTHVFGKDRAESADGALSLWDKNKMKEKKQETFSEAVADVPECFPALFRAQKVAKRMEKGGWDKATFENFEKKFREEYGELRAACKEGDKARIEEELGDVLFCMADLGRAAGADCETALLGTVKKMQARYLAYERLVRADGKDVLSLTEEEKEAYYQRAKNAV